MKELNRNERGSCIMTREDEAPELLAVTQADRDAAAEMLERMNVHAWEKSVGHIRAGNADAGYSVQAFAKHRLASTRPSSPASVEVERLREACMKQNEVICQTLGKALGYPWFKDDPENFPDATEAHGVCVGDHVAETLAAEAAERLAALTVPARPEAGEVERDMCGETVLGMRVAAYRETHPEHGDKYGHSYSEHWSTPSKHPNVKVERLFTEQQVRDLLASLPTARAGIGEDAVEGVARLKEALLNDIAVMMSEFVDNWPQPKKVSTALKLVAKALRIALDPPKHDFWGAGEPDCPREIKAGNGELHTLRCKVCGQDNPRDERCLASLKDHAK